MCVEREVVEITTILIVIFVDVNDNDSERFDES